MAAAGNTQFVSMGQETVVGLAEHVGVAVAGRPFQIALGGAGVEPQLVGAHQPVVLPEWCQTGLRRHLHRRRSESAGDRAHPGAGRGAVAQGLQGLTHGVELLGADVAPSRRTDGRSSKRAGTSSVTIPASQSEHSARVTSRWTVRGLVQPQSDLADLRTTPSGSAGLGCPSPVQLARLCRIAPICERNPAQVAGR